MRSKISLVFLFPTDLQEQFVACILALSICLNLPIGFTGHLCGQMSKKQNSGTHARTSILSCHCIQISLVREFSRTPCLFVGRFSLSFAIGQTRKFGTDPACGRPHIPVDRPAPCKTLHPASRPHTLHEPSIARRFLHTLQTQGVRASMKQLSLE